jgi:hypothetical protein
MDSEELQMSTEDQLIMEVERRGLGLDLNFIRDRYTVEFPLRRRNQTFSSMEAALRFVRQLGKI